MPNYNEIREALKSLLNNNSSQEDINKIAEVSKMIDKAEADNKEQLEQHEKLKSDYIEMIKECGFKSEDTPRVEDKQLSLEEIANGIIAKRSDRALHR